MNHINFNPYKTLIELYRQHLVSREFFETEWLKLQAKDGFLNLRSSRK